MVKSVSVVIWSFESVRFDPSRVKQVESEYERTAWRISLSGIGAQRGASVLGSGCVMPARQRNARPRTARPYPVPRDLTPLQAA